MTDNAEIVRLCEQIAQLVTRIARLLANKPQSQSAQPKPDAATQDEVLRLKAELERVTKLAASREAKNAELDRKVEELARQIYVLRQRRAPFTAEQFRMLLACLSPDGRKSISDERLAAVFGAMKELEFKLAKPKTAKPSTPDNTRHIEKGS